MAKKGKAAELRKVRKQGPSKYEQLRGPNTGHWEKMFSGWAAGAREKYRRSSNIARGGTN